MAVRFICDGCGKEAEGLCINGDWCKPSSWYQRSDKDGGQLACSRECIESVAKKTGKTGLVLPV